MWSLWQHDHATYQRVLRSSPLLPKLGLPVMPPFARPSCACILLQKCEEDNCDNDCRCIATASHIYGIVINIEIRDLGWRTSIRHHTLARQFVSNDTMFLIKAAANAPELFSFQSCALCKCHHLLGCRRRHRCKAVLRIRCCNGFG